MLGSMLSYTPGVQVRPINADAPGQLSGLTSRAPRTAQQQSFNLPASLRNANTQGQWDEMNRVNTDRYKASSAAEASSLGRQMGQANSQNVFNTLQSATGAANNYYDTMTQGLRGQQQNELGWLQGMTDLNNRRMQMFTPMLGQMMMGSY